MTSLDTPVLFTADIVYTGMGLPLNDGGVVVSGGTVAATGDAAQLAVTYPHARPERAGRVIAPPPVNAHAHLDMSAYPLHRAPFPEWIGWVVRTAREQPDLRGVHGARLGVDLLLAGGTNVVGDLTNNREVVEYLLTHPDLRGTVYWEVLNPDPAAATEKLRETAELVRGWRRLERPGGVRLGLTPHAPYTVSHALFRGLAALALQEGLPLQIHLGESASELEFFRSGTGGVAQGIERATGRGPAEILGREPHPDLSPVEYLADLGVLAARPAIVHAVHLSRADARLLAQAGSPVITCPRSNTNLQCGVFDWAGFAAEGVEVALGTDSVASGETLSVHDEIAAALALHPSLDPRVIVRAAVKGGARVVGERVPFIRRGEAWRPEYVWPEVAQPAT